LLVPPQRALDEMDRLAAEAASLMSSGSTDKAETLVQKMRSISPDDSLPRYWMRQIRATREVESASGSGHSVDSVEQRAAEMLEGRLNSIQQLITSREYREARRQIGELMVEDPDNSVIHRYLERINTEESALNAALNSAHEEAEAARRTGDYEAVAQVWRSFNEKYPGHQDIEAELAVAEKELEVRQKRAEREARLQRVRTQAERQLAAGDRQGALALWEALLRDDPGSDEARDRVETLQREIREEEITLALQRTRSAAESRIAAGNTAGALVLWKAHARAYPEDPSAGTEIAKLTEKLDRERRERVREEIEAHAVRLERRLSAGRYDGLPEVAGALRKALNRARESADERPEPPEVLVRQLVEAAGEAESRLFERLGKARGGLRDLLDQAGEVARAGEADEAAAAGPAEQELMQAVGEGAAALCEVHPPESPGDPLRPLVAATERLERSIDRLAQERREAIEQARELAASALERARAAIVAIGAFEEDPARGEADRLRQELARSGEQLQSRSAGKLAETRERAVALEQAAAALGAEAGWGWALELVSLRNDCLDLLPGQESGELAILAGRASSHLQASSAGGPAVPEGTRELLDEIRRALKEVRERKERAESEARQGWAAAQALWQQAAGSASEELLLAGSSCEKQGDSALKAGKWEEVARVSARLSVLAGRAGLEAIWQGHRELVGRIEEAAEKEEGSDDSLLERLSAYRVAFAKEEAERLRGLDAGLKRVAKRAGREGRRPEGGRLDRLPAAGRRMRAVNRALQPDALERFDRALKKYERAAAGRAGSEEPARELTRAHACLIEPDPVWPGLIPVGAAAVLLALAAWSIRPAESADHFDVTLLSPSGEVRVERLSRDGQAMGGLPAGGGVVGEAGLRWSLEPGSYRLLTGGGTEFEFRVPEDRAVVIREEATDFGAELLRELRLDDLGGTP
jgi:hypothetical protein